MTTATATAPTPTAVWPDQLFETGENYGSESFFFDRTGAEAATADLNSLNSGDGFTPLTVSAHCEEWELHAVDTDGTAVFVNQGSFCRIRQETSPSSLNSTPCEFERVEWLTAYDVKEAIELGAKFAEVQF